MHGRVTKYLERISSVLLAVLLAACAAQPPSVTTTANKSEGYTRKLQRVVLIDAFRGSFTHRASMAKPDYKTIWDTLAARLRAEGVVVELVNPGPLELEKGQAARDAAARIGATHVITLEQVIFSARVGAAFEEYEIYVLDVGLRRSIWRGRTRIETTRLFEGERENLVPTAILEKLKIDGLI